MILLPVPLKLATSFQPRPNMDVGIAAGVEIVAVGLPEPPILLCRVCVNKSSKEPTSKVANTTAAIVLRRCCHVLRSGRSDEVLCIYAGLSCLVFNIIGCRVVCGIAYGMLLALFKRRWRTRARDWVSCCSSIAYLCCNSLMSA